MRGPSTVLLIAFVASLIAIGRAPAQEIVSLDQVMREIEAQRRVDAEFETAHARVEEEARQEAGRLQHDEATLDSAETTVADLRQLRSEIDGRKIRLDVIDARIGYANAQMLRVEGSINALSQTTATKPTTIEELVQIVKLRRPLCEILDFLVKVLDDHAGALMAMLSDGVQNPLSSEECFVGRDRLLEPIRHDE